MTQRMRRLTALAMIGFAFIVAVIGHADTTRDLSPQAVEGIQTTADRVEYSGPHAFRAYRVGPAYQSLAYRDLELLWDELNLDTTVVWQSWALQATLDNYVASLVTLTNRDPFDVPCSKFQLLYEYFRNPGHGSQYNSTDADDTTAVVFGTGVEGDSTAEPPAPPYNLSDRSHVDVYLWNRATRWYHNPDNYADSTLLSNGGQHPSMFVSGEEDVSTGHAVDSAAVMHGNSIMVESPLGDSRLDPAGTGWTQPDALQNLRFVHEFRHGLPGTRSGGVLGDMFSAGAEAIGGNKTREFEYPMAYTWSLLANVQPGLSNSPTCSNLRSCGQNYQGWSAFGAYLAYNFRGTDTLATLSGIQDDLLHRWATLSSVSWETLRDLLHDNTCGTCSTRTYFHPSGAAMNDTLRLGLLLHNWRVANFVNNPALDEGQYGYQVPADTSFAFSAAKQAGAWYANGPGRCDGDDDLIVVPPEITLTAAHAKRDTVLRDYRANDVTTYPLVLQPLGSEYWVIRSDETSQVAGQDLVVTIHVDSLRLMDQFETFCDHLRWPDGRLFASAVGYREQASGGIPQPLWQHPEWATRVIEPRWTDVTIAGGAALQLVVPSFGDSVQAVVVVLSMADGPSQYYSFKNPYWGLQAYVEQAGYRLQLGLLRAPFNAQNPVRVDWLGSYATSAPTFAPDGEHVAFTRWPGAQICTTSLDNQVTAVLNSSFPLPQTHPDWSPRGDWIAYEQPFYIGCADPDILLYNTVTAERETLTWRGCGQGPCEAPAFSPNGQQIAYTFHYTGPPTYDGDWQLRRIDLSGANDSIVTQLDYTRPIRSPRWSPDGQQLYFTAGDSLYFVNANGGPVQAFVSDDSMPGHISKFDLHRGMGRIAFEYVDTLVHHRACSMWLPGTGGDGFDEDVVAASRRVALRDPLQRRPLPLFPRSSATFGDPRWSYDGTRIAYVSDANAIGSASDLYIGQVSRNHAPQFVGAPRDTVLAAACAGAQTLTQTYSATDPDGEAVTFTAAYLPGGATLSSTSGEFSWPDPGPPGSEHYVVIRALDGSGGVAQKVIRIAIEPDSLRPAAAEVMVETGRTSAAVGWVACGDDSLTGTACRSRAAYSTSAITEGNFFACDTLATNPPGEPGTLECALAPNGSLSSCTWYYFAVKTQDDAGRWSALSNVVQAKTTCSGTKIVECYAGDLMAQGGGEEGWELENSVLDLATTTAAATDVYALQTRVAPTAAQAQVRLTFRGGGSFALDQARLAVVDHPADVEVIASGNRALQGTLAAVSGIVGEPGTTLAAVIDSSEDARVVAAGTTWEVTLAGKASAEQALLVELAGWGAVKDGAGVEVQVPFLAGTWRTLAWLHPRAAAYAFVVDSLGGNQVRLVFRQECAVKRLAGLTVAQTARLEPLVPRSALHSTKGEAAEAVSASDEATLSLGKGESVVLTYALPVAKAELKRATYLLLGGSRVASRVQASGVRASGEAGAAGAAEAVRLPTAFALHQNQPNPVTGTTTVRFDLPRPARVRLEVFDLQGRRIARLVEGDLPAGYHHTEWDGRGSGGARVGAGVYLCRLQAGDFQAQRKLIVVR